MRDEGDLRSLGRTLGSAALGVSVGLGVLILGFVVSRIALPEANIVASSSTTPSATPARTVTLATATPTPTPPPQTAAPTVAPTPRPSPTPDPLVAAPYEGQGLRLAAITLPAGYTFASPIGGRVAIALYQFVAGEIREASAAASEPVYPYLFVRSADREVKLRPAAVDRDVELLVKDGDTVAAGAPLFRTKTAAASSWRTFYDPAVTAQVVASAVDLTTNVLIDPIPLFKR